MKNVRITVSRYCLVFILCFPLLPVDVANATLTNPTPVCVSETCTINFETIGDYYLWTAPSTGSFTFQVWGAQGGTALNTSGTVAQIGPLGGYAAGNYSLTSGQSVYVYVGGEGLGSTLTYNTLAGGFNGGGNGYNGNAAGRAASGGGGSDIRIGGNSLVNRVIVAGGGGGGKYFLGYGMQSGGFGGGTTGGAGRSSGFSEASMATSNGGGGEQSKGGAGGQNGGVGLTGTSGNGGNGISSMHSYGSSGGGGGFYGGGGSGVGTSPGGGSGRITVGVTSSSSIAGDASMPNPSGGNMVGRSGNGYIRITYTKLVVTSVFNSLSLAGSATTATYRTAVVITADISVASRVTFRVNGKVLPGCRNGLASGSSSSYLVTCSWRPSNRGLVSLTAAAVPTDIEIIGSSANPMSIMVGKRVLAR
jgi:hypothetical protein